jgi:hypothetical protein
MLQLEQFLGGEAVGAELGVGKRFGVGAIGFGLGLPQAGCVVAQHGVAGGDLKRDVDAKRDVGIERGRPERVRGFVERILSLSHALEAVDVLGCGPQQAGAVAGCGIQLLGFVGLGQTAVDVAASVGLESRGEGFVG